MKKYIIVFLIGSLMLPFAIFASVHGPNQCCTLNHNLDDIDIHCVVGATASADGCQQKTGAELTAMDSACIDTPLDDDPTADECWVDGDLDGTISAGDPQDYPCEDDWLDCWCDYDGDGVNEAACSALIQPTKNWGTCCIVDAIYNATDWIFYVLLLTAGIILLIAGFYFFLAGGDPSKITKAKNLIIYCGIGLLLAVMSRIIPAIIKEIVS